MRIEGESVRRIAKKLSVSYGSVSLWCRDIVLTEDQNEALRMRAESPRREALRAAVRNTKAAYAKIRDDMRREGIERVSDFSLRDSLLLGLGLYLGDGTKGGHTASFSNSNVAIQSFMLSWFEAHFGVTRDRFKARVTIHEAYRDEADDVIGEWSHALGMPRTAFSKPTFIKTRIAPEFSERGVYKGTLMLGVRKSSAIKHEILGMGDTLVYKGGAHRPG